MSFNLSGLYNNIKNSITGLGAQLGIFPQGENALYPEADLGNVKTNFKKENWNKLPLPYSFSVVDVASGEDNSVFKEFQLPLAPGEISQTEEPAISIRPTQGGTVVSHSGNKYKTLTLSGTTGIAPFRGAGGVDRSTGEAIFQPDQLKYKSGYEVFHEFRNYLKAYYEYKKVRSADPNAKKARLIWKNYKDGEFLIVELISFEMRRTAARSFLYDYNVKFRVLKHFAFKQPELGFPESLDATLNKALAKIDMARGVFLRSSDIVRQIEGTYESTVLAPIRKIGLALRAARGTGYSLADFPKNIARSTIAAGTSLAAMQKMRDDKDSIKNESVDLEEDKNRILTDLDLPSDIEGAVDRQGVDALFNLGEGVTIIDSSDLPDEAQNQLDIEINNSLDLPRSFYEDSVNDLTRIKQNAEDAFNLGSTDYDDLFDRTSTVEIDTSKIVTRDEFNVLYAFDQAIAGIIDVMSTSRFFKSGFDAQIQHILDTFDEGELPLESSDAVLELVLPAKTDLERLALRYLGDSNKWPEISELNNLKAPYITQDPTSDTVGILKPGDTILIPAPSVFGFGSAPQTKEIPSTSSLSYLEKQLGSDLKLTSDFDLSLGNGGDFNVIAGSSNMGQSVVLKLGYEKGDLIRHPELGASLAIGTKIRPLNETRDAIIRSLVQDPRVEKIIDLTLIKDNSAVTLSFKVKIKNLDIPVPVNVKL